ncbi:hypothetical protein O181_032092, partial [Austropuccinia psidii MF-1]|nr:hypothetical protein [Austropuccinia psidii MF-1]
AHVVPSHHASDTIYHPYACVVPFCYASGAAHHFYACECPPNPYALAAPSR